MDDGRQQHAELDVIAVQGDDGEAVEVGANPRDRRTASARSGLQCRYHGVKCGADDNCDGKVYDVALADEALESVQHVPD